MKVLGIYKELDEDEKVIQESSDVCEIYSKSGMGFWSWVKSEQPDVSFAKAFLTSKRLVFLSVFTGMLKELKSGKGNIMGLSHNWLELPLETIVKIETPSKFSFSSILGEKLFKHESGEKKAEMVLHVKSLPRQEKLRIGPFSISKGQSLILSVVIEQRDMWATAIENASYHARQSMGIDLEKEEQMESGKIKCKICGTVYKEDDVKTVTCGECGQEVCREKKKFLKWEKTECFDEDKFMCKACIAKSKRKRVIMKAK